LSFTDFVAVISGLLSVMGNQATLDSLLANFGALSAISGGGWYMTELAYSKEFQDLTYAMAQHPRMAGKLFNAKWMARALGAGALNGNFSGVTGLNGQVLQCMLSTFSSMVPDDLVSGLLNDTEGGGPLPGLAAKRAEAATAAQEAASEAATTSNGKGVDDLAGGLGAQKLMAALAMLTGRIFLPMKIPA